MDQRFRLLIAILGLTLSGVALIMAAVQVVFSVPDYPAFRNNLDGRDQHRYELYLHQFKTYASTAVAAQIEVAKLCAEKGSFSSQKRDIEDLVQNLNKAVESTAHTTSLYVADEVGIAVKSIGAGLNRCVEAVESLRSDVGDLRESVGESQSVSSGGSVCHEPVVGSVSGEPAESPVRGPNYERNRANRAAQKARKLKRKQMGTDWRTGRRSVDVKDMDGDSEIGVATSSVEGQGEGFWKSCSPDVRQKLVDSKAEMHIAENIRRTREARDKVAEMDSPVGLLNKAMDVVKLAEAAAKRGNDSKVAGWAKIVAASYSEEIARSASPAVQSYQSYVESNPSTVPIELFEELERKFSAEQEKQKLAEEKQKALNERIAELQRDLEAEKLKSLPQTRTNLQQQLAMESRKIDEKYAKLGGEYAEEMKLAEKNLLRQSPRFRCLFENRKC